MPRRRAPRPKAVAIRMKIRTGKYSDGKYVPGISGYVILKIMISCQVKNWNASGFSKPVTEGIPIEIQILNRTEK
jgi:hypothetical protein